MNWLDIGNRFKDLVILFHTQKKSQKANKQTTKNVDCTKQEI